MRRLISILTTRERVRVAWLLLALVILAGVEVGGIASVAVFASLLTAPERLAGNTLFQTAKEWLGLTEQTEIAFAAGLGLAAVIVLRNVFAAFCAWFRLWVIHGTRRTVARRLFASYLNQPYVFFQNINSAALSRNLTIEIDHLVGTFLFSWISIIASASTSIAILAYLLYQGENVWVTLLALLAMAVFGGGFILFSRSLLSRLGEEHRKLNESRFKTTNEAVGAIKEIKILEREPYFLNRFDNIYRHLGRTAIVFNLFTEIPRYVLEIAVVLGLLAMLFVLFQQTGNMAAVSSTMAIFIMAFYRLVPTAQNLVNGFVGLNFNRPILDDLGAALEKGGEKLLQPRSAEPAMVFQKAIRLEGVGFQHHNANAQTIVSVDAEIPKNAAIAFVGPSGAGKTTLIDLIIGLLSPDSGSITIDGVTLNPERAASWQRNVGYVPQQIFLIDDSIRNNIAFGVEETAIDDARVRAAAEAAGLTDFIVSLRNGFETLIGERGVRISGGQGQRVAIARALYRGAKVIILDEATSALDGINEAYIQDSMRNLARHMTIIIIAHRLQTVEHCDRIYLMEAGRITDSGTYSQLMKKNSTFRAMARSAS